MTNSYQAITLDDHFYAINDDFTRCFLLEGEREALLIDTGVSGGDLRGFCQTLTELPIFVVNTHADMDHVAANGQFERVYMHPADFEHAANGGFGLDNVLPIWEHDQLQLGRFTLEVLLIPGHTPGGIALWERKKGWLFTGDSVQGGNILLSGSGRSIKAYQASLDKLSGLKDQITGIYGGHGPIVIGSEYIDYLQDTTAQMLQGKLVGQEAHGDHLPIQGLKIYTDGHVKLLVKGL